MSNRFFPRKKHIAAASFLFLIISSLFSLPVSAGLGESASGFAWGGGAALNGLGYEGIGWISFNNLSDGSAANYGVNIPLTDGVLSGSAWSEHYGWLSFDSADLGNCPQGTCSALRTGNVITGWARFIAIRDAGANSGGWSGWVSLSGTATDSSPYGISIVTSNTLSGYAWSDELGWIDFSGVTFQSPTTLKVCQDSCSSSFLRGRGNTTMGFSIFRSTSQDLVACYNTAPDCSDSSGDVTTAATWAETGTPSDAISLSVAANKERVTGNAFGTESFSASYSGATATMNATVLCVPTNTCATDPRNIQVCTGETYDITDDGCGNAVICSGARFCDYNWREVAP